jgi:acyl dehydratase
VREQFTVHRPVFLDQEVVVTGAVERRYARKGRLYSTTRAETRDTRGRLLVSNCTTGLVRYRRDPDLADYEEGRAEADVPQPRPDADVAGENPALATLRGLAAGATLTGPTTLVPLELMRTRDGERSRNPIHTDPEAARRAGLEAPIAGGSHVLSFVEEVLMDAWGPEALLHGACNDVRFVGQVRAGSQVTPRARIEVVTRERVEVALEVECEGRTAVTGTLLIPLA